VTVISNYNDKNNNSNDIRHHKPYSNTPLQYNT